MAQRQEQVDLLDAEPKQYVYSKPTRLEPLQTTSVVRRRLTRRRDSVIFDRPTIGVKGSAQNFLPLEPD